MNIVYINEYVLYYIFIVKSFQITSSIQSLCEYVSPFHDTSDVVFSMFWWLQLACPTMNWLWNFCKEWGNFGRSYISTNAGFRPSAVVISSLDMILIVVAFKCKRMALHKYFPIGRMIDIKRLWNNIYCSFALFHTATVSQKGTQYQRTLNQQQCNRVPNNRVVTVALLVKAAIKFQTSICAHLWCLQSRDSQLRFNSHTVPRWSKYPILTLISDETQLLMTDFHQPRKNHSRLATAGENIFWSEPVQTTKPKTFLQMWPTQLDDMLSPSSFLNRPLRHNTRL